MCIVYSKRRRTNKRIVNYNQMLLNDVPHLTIDCNCKRLLLVAFSFFFTLFNFFESINSNTLFGSKPVSSINSLWIERRFPIKCACKRKTWIFDSILMHLHLHLHLHSSENKIFAKHTKKSTFCSVLFF